jgi:hypothetical protein
MKKVLWSDIPDDAPLPKWPPDEDVVVSKHGVKVKKPPLPPPDKTTSSNQTKKT